MDRVAAIIERIRRELAPVHLEVRDDSHHHAGHAGHGGAGHFAALVVSEKFRGLSLVQRHRLVYQAVADLMPGEIHALAISAHTPEDLPSTRA